jgi:hypothetical protein
MMTLRTWPADINSDDRMLLQYESLRKQALNRQAFFPEGSLGLALFIRRGMLTWLAVCNRCMPVSPNSDKRTEVPTFAYEKTSEMIKVMANMTLSNLEEALA